MKPEDKSKLRSFIGDIDKLKTRNPEETKFADWKKDVRKKLEDIFGKSSEEVSMFDRCRFFDFGRAGKPKDTPLSEPERREYVQCLEKAKRQLQRFL